MKKRMMAVMMVLTMTMAMCGCKKTQPTSKRAEASREETQQAAAEQNRKAPDLFGNPDKTNVSERGLMTSKDAKKPILSDVRSAYTVINWMMYYQLVSGSELTVEPIIREDRDNDAPNEMMLYVFAYNEDYAWNKEDAYVTITGASCRPIVNQNFDTIHTYWMQGQLPANMPAGKYTFVFVTTDGQVDSMMDVGIVKPEDAEKEPVAID